MNLHAHVESIKLILENGSTLTRDSLHVHVGLIIFLAVAVLARLPLHSRWPWTAAFTVAMLGEVIDLTKYLPYVGYNQLDASLHDLLNTLFWPTALMLLGRFTNVFERRQPPAPEMK